MLKLFFVAAVVLGALMLVVWAFNKISTKSKKKAEDSQKLMEAILEELKTMNKNNDKKNEKKEG